MARLGSVVAFSGALLVVLLMYSDLMLESRGQNMDDDFFGPCDSSTSSSQCNCSTRCGQIVFGGFFPLHEWHYGNNSCSSIFRPEIGFQRMEAMRWTLEKYGRDLDVGYDLRDTCSKDTNTRDEALDFINVGTNCQPRFVNRPISLVIGAASSTVSADLTSLLTLFDVPQISYSATSNALNVTKASDQARFQRFFRTVPPDSYQVDAIVDLLRMFGWTFVSVVYSNDLYGSQALESLKSSQSNSLCIGAQIPINLEGTGNPYANAITTLNAMWNGNATVIIVFAQANIARRLFEEINSSSTSRREFSGRIWIASDAWSGNMPTVAPAIDLLKDRVIGFQPYTPPSTAFEEHLKTTKLSQYPDGNRRKWYNDYFAYLFPGRSNISDNLTAGESSLFNIDPKVPFVIRAVEIGLQAVERSLLTLCGGNRTLCQEAKSMTNALQGQNFTDNLRNLAFNATFDSRIFKYDQEFTRSFRPSDSSLPMYSISVYRSVSGKSPEFVKVGNWSATQNLTLEPELETQPPFNRKSICAEPCPNGSVRKNVENFPLECCWRCQECGDAQFASATKCEICPANMTANKAKTECILIPVDFLQWSDPLAIVMIVLVILALVVTSIVVFVFVSQWTSSLVRASSRELSICLFIGFYIGCVVCLLFITKPTTATCALRRFGLSFVLSICFSALLVKTNRISRVFNRPPGKARPAYVSPEWQILFTCGFTLVQVRRLLILMQACVYLVMNVSVWSFTRLRMSRILLQIVRLLNLVYRSKVDVFILFLLMPFVVTLLQVLILVVWLIVQPPSAEPDVTQDNVRPS